MVYTSKKTGKKYEVTTEDGEPELLGEGAFCKVYLGRDKTSGDDVAIKVIQNTESTKREIETMNQITPHKNIVMLIDHIEDYVNHYLVMSLAKENLAEFICSLEFKNSHMRVSQNGDDLLRYSRHLIAGVKHLHDNAILHRDLKPGNVLIYVQGKQNILKITDFSISRILEGGEYAHTRNIGSGKYMAPEIMEPNPNYKETCDIKMSKRKGKLL